MKILLTGASSFTGYWFARALSEAGHHVTAPLRWHREAYREGIRSDRVQFLQRYVEIVDEAPFGSDRFLNLCSCGKFDLLAHHAATVGDYRNPDFDVAGALAENTRNLRFVLRNLLNGGLRGVVSTGSVFEPDEGAGELPLNAFSPYGLSKAFTSQLVRYACNELSVPFGKFVIPNPFGPLEEPRFCAYLIRTWKRGNIARVNTPAYIRDNIHVDLLAAAYVNFLTATVLDKKIDCQTNPSGYVEAQGIFAERFASAMRPRLDLACGLEFSMQTDFSEPIMRVNYEQASQRVGNWDESQAWDQIAIFYSKQRP